MDNKDIQSLSHSKWRCQYHIVFSPKYRRREIDGEIKVDIRNQLREDIANDQISMKQYIDPFTGSNNL